MTDKACEIQSKLEQAAMLETAEAAFEFRNNCVSKAQKRLHAAAYYSHLASVIPTLYCLTPTQAAFFLGKMERLVGFCDCPCPATVKVTDFGEESETPCNANPCFFIADVMFAQTVYFGLNGFYATSFGQLGVEPPPDCYTYTIFQDPEEQTLHTLISAVPNAPLVGFCWLGKTSEVIDPSWVTYHTINPCAVLPAELPDTDPNFFEVYTEGCDDPTPP